MELVIQEKKCNPEMVAIKDTDRLALIINHTEEFNKRFDLCLTGISLDTVKGILESDQFGCFGFMELTCWDAFDVTFLIKGFFTDGHAKVNITTNY